MKVKIDSQWLLNYVKDHGGIINIATRITIRG